MERAHEAADQQVPAVDQHKERILKGSEIDVGGSIIMPIAMTMVETIRSMTKNGQN